MKASTRSLGIILTFLFIGLVGYAGYELYQLPTTIAESLKREKDSRINEIRTLVINNKDKRGKNLNDRQLLRAVYEELTRENRGKESDKRKLAQELAVPAYWAFGWALVSAVALMFLLLASSFRTSAETIVYIERQEEEQDEVNQQHSLGDESKLQPVMAELKGRAELPAEKEELEALLVRLAKELNASSGAIYKTSYEESKRRIDLVASYAFLATDSELVSYEFGEGLAGQVAKTGKGKLYRSVPKGYIEVFSGLGDASPNFLAILPMKKGEEVKGIIEVAFFEPVTDQEYKDLEEIATLLAHRI